MLYIITNVPTDRPYSVSYDVVNEIRQTVAASYNKIFDKYLSLIDEVCKNVAAKLKVVADDLNKGCSK